MVPFPSICTFVQALGFTTGESPPSSALSSVHSCSLPGSLPHCPASEFPHHLHWLSSAPEVPALLSSLLPQSILHFSPHIPFSSALPEADRHQDDCSQPLHLTSAPLCRGGAREPRVCQKALGAKITLAALHLSRINCMHCGGMLCLRRNG